MKVFKIALVTSIICVDFEKAKHSCYGFSAGNCCDNEVCMYCPG
mgnify:CR=1 FL=1